MTTLRILATTDLGTAVVPMRATYGQTGTVSGVARLLERELERGPALWLDVGDLTVGPAMVLLDERPWDELAGLPIACCAVGNHDFDDGLDALRAGAARLRYPMLCANVDVGLPATALIDTPAGGVGVIGLAHPSGDAFTHAPPARADWRVDELARALRAYGARWVVALLHDGVTWWPSADSIATRADRLEALVRPWAAAVDLIIGGHNFGAWTGTLAGTPAGEAHVYAASVLVADLGPEVVVRGVVPTPAVRPARVTPAVAAFDAAAANVVGESAERWISRTGAERYLPDRIAHAFRVTSGADAAFVPLAHHGAQVPLDGVIAELPAGPVTELDRVRLFPADDYGPLVVELQAGEWERILAHHAAAADPANTATDGEWWNWCRMPAGTSTTSPRPASVAMVAGNVTLVSDWLDRELTSEPSPVSARDALVVG
ncbi:metallophosphoesterase [Solirubrobacter sp. CPCC 204708]|uniref:Metallophosphoesterase n=1 Tax=Solirubrobacter deserti TaxID=2282478 RepID=A0ABT4RG36_9ACTN|nr:metallophosphoesterase [Solirubrobacter deserti]MBE2318068.1 metallophosphoesterase [Solirubrobacter deserti]MDA0137346.1 metallophosphoesterase [Solirubrobacter deserti]